jgi:hypothetical protein
MMTLVLLAALAVSPTTGNLVVSCDKPFALYIDGEQVNVADLRTSWTVYDLTAGRHDVRVEAWPTPFRREQLAASFVDIPGGSEVRIRAEKDRMVVYETISLLAPPPEQQVMVGAPVGMQVGAPGMQVAMTGPAPTDMPGNVQISVTAPMPPMVAVTTTTHHHESASQVSGHHERHDDGRGAHRRGGHGGHGAMRPADFSALRSAIADETFEKSRLNVLRSAASGNSFTVAQVGQLVDIFDFSDGKVKAVEICRDRIVDRENAFQLYSHFEFDADKKRVRSILGR